jgi:hypothetical protein
MTGKTKNSLAAKSRGRAELVVQNAKHGLGSVT